MFRTSSIFRSRWMALLWAAGICWMAVDLTSPNDDSGAANNQSSDVLDGSSQGPSKADIEAMQSKLRNW